LLSLKDELQEEITRTERSIVEIDENHRNIGASMAAANNRIDLTSKNFVQILERRKQCTVNPDKRILDANNASIGDFIKGYSKCHMSGHCCTGEACLRRGLAGLILYPKDPKYAIICVEVCCKVYGKHQQKNYTEHQAALKWYLTHYPTKTYADLTGYSVKDGKAHFNSMSFNMCRAAFAVEQDLLGATRQLGKLLKVSPVPTAHDD
jgi:SOS-response transcriptional repressor LexA